MKTGVFTEYYKRLSKEGWFKSFVCGLVVGFAALGITSAVLWIGGFKGFWIALVAGALSAIISAPVFYRFKFRPTAKDIAKRVDKLGLEERLLTMTELEGDNSYMAMKQREDAVAALGKVDAKNIKFSVTMSMVITLAAVSVFGLAFNTVSVLYDFGKIDDGKTIIGEIIDNVEPAAPTYEVYYEVDGEGYIDGDIFQVVEEGKDASPVTAVAEDGWAFVGWSDEYAEPYRTDSNVKGDMIRFAVFQELSESDDEGDEGDGEPQDNEKPSDPEKSDSSSSSNSDGDPGEPGEGSSGKYSQKDYIYDNETYYGDNYFDTAYMEALNRLANDDTLTEEEKKLILAYLATIEK